MTFARHLKRALRKLTPAEVAASELAEAELQRLEAQSAQEFATAMVSYHTKRIDRLRGVLAAQAAQATTDRAPL
jgi:hypothetical protein